MKKRLLSLLLALTLACSLLVFPANAAEIVYSGTCGRNVTWTLDSNGLLTISGSGEMEDYSDPEAFPPWCMDYYTIVDGKYKWFSYRDTVKSVVVESGVTSIGAEAFAGCKNLTNVAIPDSITDFDARAFAGCSGLLKFIVSDDNPFYCSIDGVLLSKDKTELIAYPFGRSGAFSIPDSVTSIGSYVFYHCGLTGFSIPEFITSIGNLAFSGCSSLTSVTIPNSVTSIGHRAFEDCSKLTSVTIPDSVTSIGACAFEYCSSLTSVEIPDSVISIGSSAFHNCKSLTEVVIPDSVTSIESYTFLYCSSLTSVTIPESVTSIGEYAFSGCSNLTSVEIPDSVTSIEWGAFSGCSSLTSVTIPDSVTSIGNNAFSGCSSLTSVEIPDSVTSIGRYAFQNCSRLTSVTIPESVTSIGEAAFNNCKKLTDVYYGGNGDQWAEIPIDQNNESLTSATIHYGKPTQGRIITNPADMYISADETASFSIGTFGDVVSYQWQYEAPGEDWKDCTADYEGYDTNTLLVKGATGSANRDGYQFRCVITDINGSIAVSKEASLTVLFIETQPVDYTSSVGGVAAFRVLASESASCYQWQYKTPATGIWKNCTSATEGYNTSTILVNATIGRNGYQYRCVVTSGGKRVISNAATLIIFDIRNHPQDITISESSAAVFEIVAIGSDLNYQWQYKNPATGVWKNCSSATEGYNTSTLTVRGVSGTLNRNGYQYRCVVSSGIQKRTSNAATLTVKRYKLAITTQPEDYAGSYKDLAEFFCVAEGEEVSYYWQYSTDGGTTWNDSDGVNTRAECYIIPKTKGWLYRCTVSDKYGNEQMSNIARVIMNASVITQPKDAAVSEGETASFKVKADANERLTYQWQYKNPATGVWRNSSSVTTGYNTDTLQVQATQARNGYQYRCVVTDANGNTVTSEAATLTAFGIKTQPKNVTASKGGVAAFKVVATGSGLSYQWQYKTPSGTWKNCTSKTTGYNTATLVVDATTNRNGYQYRCVVTSGSKTLTSNAATLTVN